MAQFPEFGLIQVIASDPTVAPGVSGLPKQFAYRTDVGVLYVKSGNADTDWTLVGTGAPSGSGSGGGGAGGLPGTPFKGIEFGSGWDGDMVLDGVSNLVLREGTVIVPAGGVYLAPRPFHAESITMTGGAVINPAGWPMYCRGKISGGAFTRNGNNAALSVAGGVLSAAFLPGALQGGTGASGGGGSAGGNSATAAFPFVFGQAASKGAGTGNGNPGASGQGGSGGAGTVGASGAGGSVANGGGTHFDALCCVPIMNGRIVSGGIFSGPSGGGGGGSGGGGVQCGGGGGGGGGWIIVNAGEFDGVTINARGGNGANAHTTNNSGGGGGGGGGWVVAIYARGSAPTINVQGGAGGAGLGAGGSGGAGGDGVALPIALTA